MKQIILLCLTIFTLPLFAHQGHHHAPHTSVQKISDATPDINALYKNINSAYLLNIKPIFDHKCAACHSNAFAAPWYANIPLVGYKIKADMTEAKVHLEVSNGFPFNGHGTPIEDLEAIKDDIEKEKMPPSLYVFFHSEKKLTIDEKTKILEWTKNGLEVLSTQNRKLP